MPQEQTTERKRAILQIYTVKEVRLVDKVPMRASKWKEAGAWLTQWTCRNNFQAIIAQYPETAMEIFEAEIAKAVKVHDFSPENFEFDMGQIEGVLEGKILRFWNTGEGSITRGDFRNIAVA